MRPVGTCRCIVGFVSYVYEPASNKLLTSNGEIWETLRFQRRTLLVRRIIQFKHGFMDGRVLKVGKDIVVPTEYLDNIMLNVSSILSNGLQDGEVGWCA